MRMSIMIFLFGLFHSNTSLFSQSQKDSIILLNGRVFRGDTTWVHQEFIYYTGIDKKGDIQQNEMSTYRVFSYTQAGKETILYQQDEFKGDYLTVTEAQHTTLGSYDARQTYKPRFVFWSSLALGLGASIFDTYFSQRSLDKLTTPGLPPPDLEVGFFGSDPTIFPFFIPIGLSAAWGIPTFRVKEKQMLQKNMYGNEMYYRGFHRIAKQKRIFAALKGSVIGIGTGMIMYSIFKIN